ncbi:hypothetical protein GCM10011352_27310 [Marinobacterium zhoushanense]|uniref:Helix-turn-helix domain-containing protein n=1 Tax=Marinobacterium zhoushanense TaxID=1679163 RepID=A0ABQ1KL97_9GAMM|nr:winged helix-turn-helix domain-containing protein [Marinobacterium zhoushanense]GGB99651.1 hypothetical protein GCM10011352_27310 [Marinobacterium zhoushanense]
MNTSKAALAFQRKLFLAWLISQQEHSLPSLQKATGMPRRTLQDTLKTLSDIGIDCEFVQSSGERNNQGHYLIRDWGPIDPEWVSRRAEQIATALEIPPQS